MFIVDIQQDIKEYFTETSAKLRVLVQKAEATAFGEHFDPLPLNLKLSDAGYIGV